MKLLERKVAELRTTETKIGNAKQNAVFINFCSKPRGRPNRIKQAQDGNRVIAFDAQTKLLAPCYIVDTKSSIKSGSKEVHAATPANSDIGAVPRDDISRRYQHAAGTNTSSFRRASLLPHVYAAEAKYALPPGLLDALVWTESRYNPLAVSRVGAAGLGQLMPATARELGVANRFDPVANIDGAARYLRQMLDRFGVVHLALAAYNAGPGAVRKAGGIPRNGETPAYVRNVLLRWKL